MKTVKRITFSFVLSYLILNAIIFPNTINAVTIPCSPFRAKIISVENERDCLSIRTESGCGGSMSILNKCDENFVIYEDGMTDEKKILGNYDKEVNKKINKEGILSIWLPLTPTFNPDCLKNEPNPTFPDTSTTCWPNENPKGFENTPNGTVVKSWKLTLISLSNNGMIEIHGQTVYEKPSLLNYFRKNLRALTESCAMLLISIGIILLVIRPKRIDQSTRKILGVSCILAACFLFFTLWISQYYT